MINIGEYNELTIGRETDFGYYLNDGEENEVLLPQRYITDAMHLGDRVRVFVYNDSEGRPVATTETPVAVVGDFALMRVKAVNPVGAFLDWGLTAKDLLVPFREQRVDMRAGRSYIVRVYLDEASNRVVASAKLDRFLAREAAPYPTGKRVEVLIVQHNELGYRVIVDNRYWGMLYQNQLFRSVNIGERHPAYVRQVRDDGKIDLTLEKVVRLRVDNLSHRVLDYMREHGGTLSLGDKSSPEEITAAFQCSKKDFKRTLGQLYKQQLIVKGDDGRWIVAE